MKNTIYAVVFASLAMLATSGVVALATAAAEAPAPEDAAEAFVGAMLTQHYHEVMARAGEAP